MVDKLEELFTKHPIVTGIVLLSAVVGIFYAMDFRNNQLLVIVFIAIIIEIIAYFDARIKKLEMKVNKRGGINE